MQGFLQPFTRHEAARDNLTNREKEVLIAIAEGLSAKETGHKLHIALGTVRAHKASIYSKLNLHSVPAVVGYAIWAGLIQIGCLDQRFARRVMGVPEDNSP
jgi:NarL family two-component system response regulator LiaR